MWIRKGKILKVGMGLTYPDNEKFLRKIIDRVCANFALLKKRLPAQ
jgi:hypothetical protein